MEGVGKLSCYWLALHHPSLVFPAFLHRKQNADRVDDLEAERLIGSVPWNYFINLRYSRLEMNSFPSRANVVTCRLLCMMHDA